MEKYIIILGVILIVLLTVIYYVLLLLKFYKKEIIRFLSDERKKGGETYSEENISDPPPIKVSRVSLPEYPVQKMAGYIRSDAADSPVRVEIQKQPSDVDYTAETVPVNSGTVQQGGISMKDFDQLIKAKENPDDLQKMERFKTVINEIRNTDIFVALCEKIPDLEKRIEQMNNDGENAVDQSESKTEN